MASGCVKFFAAEKGYGFITSDGGGPDVFLHIDELKKDLGVDRINPGQRVSFETAPGRNGKGPKAVKVALVK